MTRPALEVMIGVENREGTMRQELMFWLRMTAVALGAVAIVGVVILLGGPATEMVALR